MSTEIERLSFQKVMKNLNKELNKIPKKTMKGFIEAAADIRKDMDHVSPKIPVGETGNLRGSWFTSPVYSAKGPTLYMGFEADYALPVHEMYGANFKRPGAGAGFFVGSIHRNRKKSLETIRKEAKIK